MNSDNNDNLIKKKSRQIPLRKNPELIKILLKDRTTKKNIIWASDSYSGMGKDFLPETSINEKWITNGGSKIIQPRIEKHIELQKERTKVKAEVFTPTWIVKKQNDLIEEEIKDLPLNKYIKYKWLEITCGEAPYMCSRYDATTGKPININERVGFVDRKLQRINNEIHTHDEWIKYVYKAYQASYGYEFQGDSLLIARENLVYTFVDYYLNKFNKMPNIECLKEICNIVSYNVFQMDGLKYIIPYSEIVERRNIDIQLSFFEEYENEDYEIDVVKEGIKVIIKDWSSKKMITFESLLTEGGMNV